MKEGWIKCITISWKKPNIFTVLSFSFFSFFFFKKNCSFMIMGCTVIWYNSPLRGIRGKKDVIQFLAFFPISFCVFYFCAVLKSDTHFRGWCAILRWVDWSGPLTTHAYGVHLQDLLLVRCMEIRYIEDNIYICILKADSRFWVY